jgi:nucleotide-binding universal stress UspA family protein
MRIVFATDRSDASEAAVASEAALDCLETIGVSDVHLFTVVPDSVGSAVPGLDTASDAESALRSQRSAFEAAGFDVETHVARGTPFRRINGLAERLPADMIVVGSRGQSPLRNRLVGDTVRNVARTAVVPLLVARIERVDGTHSVAHERLFRDVLYVTDFSENAERAYDFLPRLRGAAERVTLLHVRGGDGPAGGPTATPRERLDTLAEDLAVRMGVETAVNVRTGNAKTEILAEERRVDATVTVLGARGQSRLRRLLLGSVSESVVARGTANVLLVPPASVPPR